MKPLSLLCLIFAAFPSHVLAGAGTEAASFLDIPVGAEPASLGSAYTARAENAYATVWNPAGLGRVVVPEMSAMYLSYLVDTSYQQASFAVPWKKGDNASGFGLSIQTIGSGEIDGRNIHGVKTADFTSRFSAYSFAYGQTVTERLSVGTTVKIVQQKISDASASAYALDQGVLFNWTPRLTLGAAIANVGTRMKLVDQSDPLPMQGRGGLAWRASPDVQLFGEAVYRRSGVFSGHLGTEWSPGSSYAIRLGYQTSHTKELGAMAGFTAGFGLRWRSQEFAYAFVPFGELGSTHYLSIVLRKSSDPRPDRAHPGHAVLQARTEKDDPDFKESPKTHYSDYRNLYDILSEEERKSLKKDRNFE